MTATRKGSDGYPYPVKWIDEVESLAIPGVPSLWVFWSGLPRLLPNGKWVRWHCMAPLVWNMARRRWPTTDILDERWRRHPWLQDPPVYDNSIW